MNSELAGPRAPLTATCVWDRIAESCRSHPEAVAASFEGAELSYAALDQRSLAIAQRLSARGISKGDLVGVHLERGLELLVLLLGIWRAGAAYLPLDPQFPEERLEWMLQNAGLRLLVTESLGELAALSELEVSTLASFLAEDPADASLPAGEASDLAYVIYTSGSTGRPKGVEVPQSAVVNFLESMQEEPGFTRDDVLVSVTTLSFDISVLELFLPLFSGGKTVLVDRETSMGGRPLLEVIREQGVTVMQATPSTWYLMLEAGLSREDGLRVLCGGEAMPPNLARDLLECSAELWNLYGPTETTVWSTCRRIRDAAQIDIGLPIRNTSVVLLDEQGRVVPSDTTGEIWIGGAGLARGYRGRPDLTSERFAELPSDRGRHYRTGDLGRLLPDGRLLCLGRVDHQVKLRGHRVELGDVEAALNRVDGVRQAAATVFEDADRGTYMAAYFVPSQSDEPPEPPQIRAALESQLPHYMLPQELVALDELPLTPNGKVDRKRLPEPAVERPSGEESFEAMLEGAGHEHVEVWRRSWIEVSATAHRATARRVLLIGEPGPLLEATCGALKERGDDVLLVLAGDEFGWRSEDRLWVQVERAGEHLPRCFGELRARDWWPDQIVHGWSLTGEDRMRPGFVLSQHLRERGAQSLAALERALRECPELEAPRVLVLGVEMFACLGGDRPCPDRALTVAAALSPKEPFDVCDLDWETDRVPGAAETDWLAEFVASTERPAIVARRGGRTLEARCATKPATSADDLVLPPADETVFLGAETIAGRRALELLLRSTGGAPRVLVGEGREEAVRRHFAERGLEERVRLETLAQPCVWSSNRLLALLSTHGGATRDVFVASFPILPNGCELGSLALLEALGSTAVEARLRSVTILTASNSLLCLPGDELGCEASVYASALAAGSQATRWRTVAMPALVAAAADDDDERDSILQRDLARLRDCETESEGQVVAFRRALAGEVAETLACRVPPGALGKWLAQRRLEDPRYLEIANDASPTETRLLEIWQRHLGKPLLGVEENFFDAGGHSLAAVRVAHDIEQEFEVELPLARLLENASVRSMAAWLASERLDPGRASRLRLRHVVSLAPGDERETPLFLAAGALGNVLNLRYLAGHLSRPVHGLQARGLLGGEKPHDTIEQAARDYVEELQAVQPLGPYLLGGFCSGGLIALEMARILKDRGQEVLPLVLLDTELPDRSSAYDLWERIRSYAKGLRESGFSFLAERWRSWQEWRRGLREETQRRHEEQHMSGHFRSETIRAATERALLDYRPEPYSGEAWLFRPPLAKCYRTRKGVWLDRNRQVSDETNELRSLVPEIRVIQLDCRPGDHDGFVMEPFVQELAWRLETLVEASAARASEVAPISSAR